MSYQGKAVALGQLHGASSTGLFVSRFWVVHAAAVGCKRRRKQAEQQVRFALQEGECCFLYLRMREEGKSSLWIKGNGICHHWRHGVRQAEEQPDVAVHVCSGLLWGVRCQGFAKWDASCKQVKVVAMRCLQTETQCLQLQQCFVRRRACHPEPAFSEDEHEEAAALSDSSADSGSSSSDCDVPDYLESWCPGLSSLVRRQRSRRRRQRLKQEQFDADHAGSQSLSHAIASSLSDSDSDYVDSKSQSRESRSTLPDVEPKEVRMLQQLADRWYSRVKPHESRSKVKQEVKVESSRDVEQTCKHESMGKVGVRASRTVAFKLLFGRISNTDAYWSKHTMAAFWKSTQSHYFNKGFVRNNMHLVPDRIECFDGFIHKCDIVAHLK